MTIPNAKLDEIAAAAEKASPGPWTVHAGVYEGSNYRYLTDGKSNLADEIDPEDADYLARLDPQTVLALIARVRTSEAERDQLAADLREVRKALTRATAIPIEAREGNMLLDNEPPLFVKGYEAACGEIEDRLRAALPKET